MKRTFGNTITRLLWGGVSLSSLEAEILGRLLEALPAELRTPTATQLNACNLVQREVDGRALNFYRRHRGRVSRAGLPDLPIRAGEVLLLRIAFEIPGVSESFHATMTAIDKQFFCISFSHDLRPFKKAQIKVQDVTQSWRSNVTFAAHHLVPADHKVRAWDDYSSPITSRPYRLWPGRAPMKVHSLQPLSNLNNLVYLFLINLRVADGSLHLAPHHVPYEIYGSNSGPQIRAIIRITACCGMILCNNNDQGLSWSDPFEPRKIGCTSAEEVI